MIELNQLLKEVREQIQQQMIVDPEERANPILSQQRFRYIQYLKAQAAHLHQILQQEERRLDEIREAMREAHVKKKSLEVLEEKQKKAYLNALELQEMKELEDIITARQRRA